MAAAIANAEIATRLGIAYEALETVNVRALSAGVSARVGAPLTDEAAEVLRLVERASETPRSAKSDAGTSRKAELIFCMTKAHRQAVVEMLPIGRRQDLLSRHASRHRRSDRQRHARLRRLRATDSTTGPIAIRRD